MSRITFISRMTIKPGREQDFVDACNELTAMVRANEPGVIYYEFFKLREPRRYLAAVPQALQSAWVERDQLPFEFMLNGLRLLDGFSRQDFERGTGLAWQQIEATVEDLCHRGLLESAGTSIRPSARGLVFLNDALVQFLPDKTDT